MLLWIFFVPTIVLTVINIRDTISGSLILIAGEGHPFNFGIYVVRGFGMTFILIYMINFMLYILWFRFTTKGAYNKCIDFLIIASLILVCASFYFFLFSFMIVGDFIQPFGMITCIVTMLCMTVTQIFTYTDLSIRTARK